MFRVNHGPWTISLQLPVGRIFWPPPTVVLDLTVVGATVVSRYIVVRRHGAFTEPLKDAPLFEDEAEAERWAASYVAENPERFKTGISSLVVKMIEEERIQPRPA
jgi:hypothetical protein